MPYDERKENQIEDGNTPLDTDESAGLIPPHLITRADLNQWEVRNIGRAIDWIAGRPLDVLNLAVLQELHRRMFDETWEWAGTFRKSDKNISPYHWSEVPRHMRDLLANTRVQYEQSVKTPTVLDELAVRFHYELGRIHPWPNGNGRHSRLATDLLLSAWGRPPFTWGSGASLARKGGARSAYIDALRRADGGDLAPLLAFVRG